MIIIPPMKIKNGEEGKLFIGALRMVNILLKEISIAAKSKQENNLFFK